MIVSLVIPVYNEEKIIADTIIAVKNFMEKNFNSEKSDLDYEVIFVNDGSRDNTLKIAEALADEKIRVLRHSVNKGKGGAVRTGMLDAIGDIVFYTDCDLAYGLDVLVEACEIFKQNKAADALIGSRKLHKEGYESYNFMRKLASVVFLKLLRIYGGIKFSDSQSGFKGFRKDVCKKIFSVCETDGWAFDVEVLLIAQKLNLKIIEMPVKIINHGSSKISLKKDSVKMLKDIAHIKKSVKNRFGEADKDDKTHI